MSVIMAVHNAEQFLDKSISSILLQTLSQFEFIIVDDASTDNSASILDEMAKKDKRIKIIKNHQNIGLTKSLNKALLKAKGKYIARQDADDCSALQRLEKQVLFLDKHKDVALVGTSTIVIDEFGESLCMRHCITDPALLRKTVLVRNCFFHGSIMFRKKDIEQIGRYREKFVYGQDYDLYIRLSEKRNLANIDLPLYYWRFTRDSISAKQGHMQNVYGSWARAFAKERRLKGLDSYDVSDLVDLGQCGIMKKSRESYVQRRALFLIEGKKFHPCDKNNTVLFLKNPYLFVKYICRLLKS